MALSEQDVEEYLNQDRVYIFGYGSLVWRPSFPFVSKECVFVKGWIRRFWQGSPDHRGTPEFLGRVVTILPASSSFPILSERQSNPDTNALASSPASLSAEWERTWGISFELAPQNKAEVLNYLDEREKAGFSRAVVQTFTLDADGNEIAGPKALMYMATSENEHFLGEACPVEMAKQISRAKGESGPNFEYLFNLANALRELQLQDDHVFELERLVRKELGLLSASLS